MTCRLLLFLSLFAVQMTFSQQLAFEKDPKKNKTATYEELIAFYQNIVANDSRARLLEVGTTDIGKPLHLLVLSADRTFEPQDIKKRKKTVLLINNGIHPGEPEGMDASMLFVRQLLKENKLPKQVVICLIPVYNVAGMLNRGVSRANQNGPEEYGFRGSAQHYDLNRDFIKTDTRNAWLFQEVFNTWDPDVFFDTHTSNGADYQYIMTLIATHRDKLDPALATFMERNFTAPLYTGMAGTGFPMIPYVDPKEDTPESGLVSFLESPRYSTGYAALHHTIGYMPETHMWKPYADRVAAMYTLMGELLRLTTTHGADLIDLRREIKRRVREQESFPLTWKLDEENVEQLPFLGYQAGYKPSELSGLPRLFYDRSKPTSIQVPYFSRYTADIYVQKPQAYIVPQSYEKVIALLKLNGVEMQALDRDTLMHVEQYYIDCYKTSNSPYEGHYLHREVLVRPVLREQMFYKGDLLITTDQEANRYIMETLEPQATDSFFNWNFFDAILSQKEYFSPYIFEEEAVQLLRDNPQWREELERAKQNDQKLASSGRAQLDWVYKKSKYYESGHLLYPIARLHKL
ncbi:M14 family zinc carboxypeptidase [Sphingobacterium bambusae]|uniref:M14 family zinc carboxypeptidase n=1 Tax=Sphingobacterium bambusae TaxID=662858 RepID=A0ABW6BPL1_9SPHI|nr:M14 family zinc carboxypeptidase [Sphingobacterium bambusae]WPL49951.1 M14 family zinc carboxypeptidase [Sphingobacterium bambusae]